MTVGYNENDRFAAQWLRNLIAGGHLPDGHVDDRSIADLQPEHVRSFTQYHFFAGIGGWPLALEIAGWPATRPVWTGSCPCQPFSAAGKRRGAADERHLWPELCRLIAECQPATLFGEQVASRDGREWLAGVRADLEALGYAVGAADLCAASAGAPHIRQRLFWVAQPTSVTRAVPSEQRRPLPKAGRCGATSGVADADKRISGQGCALGSRPDHRSDAEQGAGLGCGSFACGLGDAECGRCERRQPARRGSGAIMSPSHWGQSGWLNCLDGKARRVEPGIFPLADGLPNRVGTLRGSGNAIVPQVAAEFVRAFLLTETD